MGSGRISSFQNFRKQLKGKIKKIKKNSTAKNTLVSSGLIVHACVVCVCLCALLDKIYINKLIFVSLAKRNNRMSDTCLTEHTT